MTRRAFFCAAVALVLAGCAAPCGDGSCAAGQICASGGDCQSGAAAIVVTRWPEFRVLPGLLGAMSPRPLLVDTRRMLDKSSYAPYLGVGLG